MNPRIASSFYRLLVLFCVSWATHSAWACDPNDELPGALPPAPNGGELGEVKRLDKKLDPPGDEAKSDEPKLFWEGVHLKEARQVSLTLVTALPPKTAVFTILSPQQEFSDIQVKVEKVREGKIVAVPFSVLKDRVVVNFDGSDLNRFVVHIEGRRPDGMRKALVQIEEE